MFATLQVLRPRAVLVVGLIAVTPFLANQVAMASLPPGSTTTTLSMTSGGNAVASGGSVVTGSVVTLTATVTGAGNILVTVGQVNFCDATAILCTDIHLLGTAQLTSSGTATVMFHPAPGQHSLKAVFLGTPHGTAELSASSSTPASLAVTETNTRPPRLLRRADTWATTRSLPR